MAKKKGKKRQQKKQAQQQVSAAAGAPPALDAANAAEGDDEGDEDEGDDEAAPAGATPAGATPTGIAPAPTTTTSPAAGEVVGTSVEPVAPGAPGKPDDAKAATPASAPPTPTTTPAPETPEAKPTEPATTPPGSWPATLAQFLQEQFAVSNQYVYVLIAAVVFAAYANARGVPFLFDDAPVITRNRNFHELSFKNAAAVINQHKTRAITNLTFYLNYHVAGTPAYQYNDGTYGSTFTYHLVSFALHAGNGMLLFLLLQTLLSGRPSRPQVRATAARRAQNAGKGGGPPPEPEDPTSAIATWIALGATLLWLVHPVQTMAVSYIAQRYALLAATFSFATMLCYAKLRRRMEAGTAWTTINSRSSHLLAAGVPFFFIMGGLSKENAAVTAILLPMMELTFFASTERDTGSVPVWLEVIPAGLRRWVLPALLLFFFGGAAMVYVIPDSAPTFPTRMSYFRTEWVVLLKYLKLYFWPNDLTVEHNFPPLDWSNPDHAWEMMKALAGHALIGILAIHWWLTNRRFLTFCVFSYYVLLGPESSIAPILDGMVEHRLYLPSAMIAAGLAFVVGRSAASIWTYGPDWTRDFARRVRGIFPESSEEPIANLLSSVRASVHANRHGIACTLLGTWTFALVALGIGTHVRNRVWDNSLLVWQDTVEKRPDCARAYSSLGMEYLYKAKWVEAVEPIEAALQLGPYHVEGWNNIGKAYLELGSNLPNNGSKSIRPNPLLIWARDTLMRGIEVNEVAPSPSVPLCWNNLGLTYLKLAERTDKVDEQLDLEAKAAVALSEAVKLDPYYETAYINLGTSYVRQADKTTDPLRKKELGVKAMEALRNSGTLRKEHQLYGISALNYALACRSANRHAEAFAMLFDVSKEDPSPAIFSVLAEEAALAAEESYALKPHIAEIERRLKSESNANERTQLTTALDEARQELATAQKVKPILATLVDRFEAEAENAGKAGDLRNKVRLFRTAGRLAYFAKGDVARAVADYDKAIAVLQPGDERNRFEQERLGIANAAQPEQQVGPK